MPFRPDPFLKNFERLRTLRKRPALGYLVATAGVGVASVLRQSFSDLLEGIPFAPYFIVVALTAAAVGAPAGLLALVLSVVAANYLERAASAWTSPASIVASGLFVVIAGTLLMLIWLLNHAIDRIWRQAERTRSIVEFQPAGVIGVDNEGRITLVNTAVERQLGYSREELFDRPIEQLVPLHMRGAHADLRRAYLEHPESKMMGAGRDLSALAKDGSLLPVEIGLNPVVDRGRTGALATIVDISERKTLEQRAQILANEVSHRARNLLMVVRALALRKLPRESSAEFVRSLEALARTQEIFGRQTVAPLRSILESEFSGFSADTNIVGCDVLLTPAAAQDFSLVVHELATNAFKYGALSRPGGLVRIEGHEADGLFRFVWKEEGGPPIAAPPQRAGFGQKILQEVVKGLNGRLTIDYLHEGLQLELVAPMGRITNVSELATKTREM